MSQWPEVQKNTLMVVNHSSGSIMLPVKLAYSTTEVNGVLPLQWTPLGVLTGQLSFFLLKMYVIIIPGQKLLS